ncbi:hypothetical protein D3C85_716490 [compost metagenome]
MTTDRNTILLEQEMAKRARIKKEFLAHADDFNNIKMTIQKLDDGYILSKNEWVFKITPAGIEQMSKHPESSGDYWVHDMMQKWMTRPVENSTKRKK